MNRLKILCISWKGFFLASGFFLGVLIVPHYSFSHASGAEEETSEQKTAVEATGTVDSVHENSLVIDDSVFFMDDSLQLYDKNGNRTDLSSFKVGDQVVLTSIKDKQADRRRIISVRLTGQENGKEKNTASGREKVKSPQEMKKVDGVWIN